MLLALDIAVFVFSVLICTFLFVMDPQMPHISYAQGTNGERVLAVHWKNTGLSECLTALQVR